MFTIKITPIIFIFLLSINSFGQGKEKKLFSSLLQKNNFVMIRHALAPGFGDPENFKLNDCKTQRNLSKKGKDQSKKIGHFFKKYNIKRAILYSSQWCRCVETATLMNIGKVNQLPFLNSFFQNFDQKPYYIKSLKNWLLKNKGKSPLVLVTHQVTITGLTDYFPDSGELVFVKLDNQNDFKVYGTLKTR